MYLYSSPILTTGSLLINKPEATGMVIIAR